MGGKFIEYPDIFLPRLRYQFCPMCRTGLSTGVINDDKLLPLSLLDMSNMENRPPRLQ